MRLSRPCYDKPHRCPSWAGGGMHYPKSDEPRDCTGHVHALGTSDEWSHPAAGWRALWFGRCTGCGVVTWPWAARRLSPFWWRTRLG